MHKIVNSGRMIKKLSRKALEIAPSFLVIVIMAVLVIGSLFYFFAKTTSFFGEGSCDLKNIEFMGDLPNRLSLLAGPQGYKSRDKFTFKVPCGDRAYFVNLNKIKTDAEAKKIIFDSLKDEPLIKSEIESNTGKNFFVMNGGKMAAAYNLQGLSVDYPYNLCFDTSSSRTVKIEMEGLGKDGVNIIPYCEQVECTTVPEIVQGDDLDELLNIACGTQKQDDDCHVKERENIQNAQEKDAEGKSNIEVRLRVSTCFPETTKVEFFIKPKNGIEAKEVKFIETLSKTDCFNDLSQYLEKVEGGDADTDVLVKSDPMLVWSFNALSEEKRVAYQLAKIIDDKCRKQLKAVAVPRLITTTGGASIKTGKDHPKRLEQDDGKRGEPLPDDIQKIPGDLKGKRMEVGDEDPATNQRLIRQLGDKEEHKARKAGQIQPGGNTAPRIDFGNQDKFTLDSDDTNLLIKKIWEFANDREDRPERMIYRVDKLTETTSTSIRCDINNGFVTCDGISSAQEGVRATFKVSVTDSGGMIGGDTFEIIVIKT